MSVSTSSASTTRVRPDGPTQPQRAELTYFSVDNLDTAEERVLRSGAELAEHQPGGRRFRVFSIRRATPSASLTPGPPPSGTNRRNARMPVADASGVEIDLTRGQFENGQTITGARAVQRPAPLPRRREDEYILLRDRLATRLGPLPAPNTAPNDEHPIP